MGLRQTLTGARTTSEKRKAAGLAIRTADFIGIQKQKKEMNDQKQPKWFEQYYDR